MTCESWRWRKIDQCTCCKNNAIHLSLLITILSKLQDVSFENSYHALFQWWYVPSFSSTFVFFFPRRCLRLFYLGSGQQGLLGAHGCAKDASVWAVVHSLPRFRQGFWRRDEKWIGASTFLLWKCLPSRWKWWRIDSTRAVTFRLSALVFNWIRSEDQTGSVEDWQMVLWRRMTPVIGLAHIHRRDGVVGIGVGAINEYRKNGGNPVGKILG